MPQEDKSVSVLNSEYKRNSKITNLEATQVGLTGLAIGGVDGNGVVVGAHRVCSSHALGIIHTYLDMYRQTSKPNCGSLFFFLFFSSPSSMSFTRRSM